MRTINELDFFKILASEIEDHFDLIIEITEYIKIDLSKITEINKFDNCQFIGERIDFTNTSLTADSDLANSFFFEKCEFLNDIYFKECFIQQLDFSEISGTVKNLHIAPNKLDYFHFDCEKKSKEKPENEINITFHDCQKINTIDFLHLESKGTLLITNCEIENLKIHDSSFDRVHIDNNKFTNFFQFTSNFIGDSYIKYNEFNKTNFSSTDFGRSAEFRTNDFNGTALFEKLKNKNRTGVKFRSCNFKKYTYFNHSTLYDLQIDTSKFQETSSFQDLELNQIFLDRTIFEKPAFFDDIEILRFNKCNKRTLRNIKQQLLLADNKIDYDNFRAHELNSYKEELKIKLKTKKGNIRRKARRDLTILRVNSFFSNNGTDWVKAIKRTVLIALLFYSTLYALHNYSKEFSFLAYNDYLIGLFKYFLITDFHNPLNNEYLENASEWILLVLGKILIAIGIYEILISFRKFKK